VFFGKKILKKLKIENFIIIIRLLKIKFQILPKE